MLNLAHAWRVYRRSDAPTSNDPYAQKRINMLIWERFKGAQLGRSIMAWVAITGWVLFSASLAVR